MMRRLIGLVLLLVLASTCGDSTPTTPTTPAPSQPTLASLAITGGSSVQPGESHQFSAIATLSDRSTRDVTADATWRVSNQSVFTVASGLVTASSFGEAFLTASYQGRNASLSIISITSGTGVLAGSVMEGSFAIAGARIEVMDGPFAGRSTTSEAGGFYRIYGLVGDLQIRASGPDYVPQTRQVNVAPLATPRRDQILNFDLTSSRRAIPLAGDYQATLRASGRCGPNLPAEMTTRNYIATVNQDGSRLSVVLSGAEFGTISPGVMGDRFAGRVIGDRVEFQIGSLGYYYYYYSWGIVERMILPSVGPWGVAQGLYLTFLGNAAGPATPSTISAVLSGNLGLYDAPTGFNQGRRRVTSCGAPDHQLVLTRQ